MTNEFDRETNRQLRTAIFLLVFLMLTHVVMYYGGVSIGRHQADQRLADYEQTVQGMRANFDALAGCTTDSDCQRKYGDPKEGDYR